MYQICQQMDKFNMRSFLWYIPGTFNMETETWVAGDAKKVHIFIVSFQNAKQGGNCFESFPCATRKEPYKNSLTHRCLYLCLLNRSGQRLCCLTFCMISLPYSLGQADSFAATSNSPSKRSWERDEQMEDVSKCSGQKLPSWRFHPLKNMLVMVSPGKGENQKIFETTTYSCSYYP